MIVESPVGVELLTCHHISFDSIKSQKWIATNAVYFENQKISSKSIAQPSGTIYIRHSSRRL
jgi:hypothetical protein